jgi:hypothetical protein
MYAVILTGDLEATYEARADADEHFREQACTHCGPCSLGLGDYLNARSHRCGVADLGDVEVAEGSKRVRWWPRL